MKNITAYADESGATDDPRSTITNTASKDAEIKTKIKEYDNREQDDMLLLVSHALAGRKSTTSEFGDAVENILSTDQAPEKRPPQWALDDLRAYADVIDELLDRHTDSWDLRKYETDEGKTPAEINDKAAESDNAMSLMAMNAAISMTGDVNVYHLESSDEYIVCRMEFFESTTGMTAYVGRRQGTFTAEVVNDPDDYFNATLRPDGWRRARDLS